MAGREMARAKSSPAGGKIALALHHLDIAQAWVPVFAYHSDLIYQRGWLDRNLGLNSPEVEVYAAIREEIEGFTRGRQEPIGNRWREAGSGPG